MSSPPEPNTKDDRGLPGRIKTADSQDELGQSGDQRPWYRRLLWWPGADGEEPHEAGYLSPRRQASRGAPKALPRRSAKLAEALTLDSPRSPGSLKHPGAPKPSGGRNGRIFWKACGPMDDQEARILNSEISSMNSVVLRGELGDMEGRRRQRTREQEESQKEQLERLSRKRASWRRKHEALMKKRTADVETTLLLTDANPENDSAGPASADGAPSRLSARSADGGSIAEGVPDTDGEGGSWTTVLQQVAGVAPTPQDLTRQDSPATPRRSPGMFPGDRRPLSVQARARTPRTMTCPAENRVVRRRSARRVNAHNGGSVWLASTIGCSGRTPRATIQPQGFRTATLNSSRPSFGDEDEVRDGGTERMAQHAMVTNLTSLGKQYNMHITEVRARYKEFRTHGGLETSGLTLRGFHRAARERLGMHQTEEIPPRLLGAQFANLDPDADVRINFEEYIIWSTNVAFAEEVMVPDRGERELRAIARKLGVAVCDLEQVRQAFDAFDTDRSGFIDREEFGRVLLVLLRAKNPTDLPQKYVDRNWFEIDLDNSGTVDFEEFAIWYFKFVWDGEPRSASALSMAASDLETRRQRTILEQQLLHDNIETKRSQIVLTF